MHDNKKKKLIKPALICLLLLLTFTVRSQDFFTLTLSGFEPRKTARNFSVTEVIDGRKNKAYIGWAETGLYDKKRFAVFENPLADEVGNFIIKGIVPKVYTPIAIRVTHLHVSDQRGDVRAEISMEYFLKEGRSRYYYITSTHSVSEIRGADMTHLHSKNLGDAIMQGVNDFAQLNWEKLVNKVEMYDRDNLERGMEISLDPDKIEILNSTKYPDGVFKSFSEFMHNKPSIVSNYKVKPGKNPSLWITENGEKLKIQHGVYGFAHQNQLYILFNNRFYLLEKRDSTFYFVGPYIADQKAYIRNAVGWGAAVGAITATTKGRSYEYKINMNNGFVVGSHGL